MNKLLAASLAAICMTLGASEPAKSEFDQRLERAGTGPVSNLACGIAPIPPLGCKIGACVCDERGQNCRWTFICG